MLQYLETLGNILQTGMMLEKKEVIRRYRSVKNFNQRIMNLILMTDFFMLGKNDKGQMVIV